MSAVLAYVLLLVITAAAWLHVLSSALATDDMGGMDMGVTAFVVAWAVMMAAMMLPSAAPMIGLYAATQRNVPGRVRRVTSSAVFTLIYLGVWAVTGVPIYFASAALGGITSDALSYGVAAVLVVAGIFQVSPLKLACLRNCRSPLGIFVGHWRPGWRGSFAIGWVHALYCLGCCWALMVVLVAAGAMGLPWVLLISAVVAAEKLLPRGEWIARMTGIALVLLGLAVAVRPGLAAALRSSGPAM